MENKHIVKLFENWATEKIESIKALPQSGSYRQYYRIQSVNKSAIAVINSDYKENLAFVSFSKHFKTKHIPVPEIYAEDLENDIYLQQDLGDISLYDFIHSFNFENGDENRLKVINIYKKVIDQLLRIQILGIENFDFSKCYPRAEFDKQSILWDLNYFKYCFLKIAKVPFNEQDLETDFNSFSDFLLKAHSNFFLFRDFQSRNIMILENEPYFIDYQGGRRGALQYDLASLLFDAKANLSVEIRNELLEYYTQKLTEYTNISKTEFNSFFPAFALVRIMQAMGAYGFRGLIERKLHFIQSIPPAIENLKYIINNYNINVEIPTLLKSLKYLTEKSEFAEKKSEISKDFILEIKSFSYRNRIPENKTEHGGGFVFDCRSLPNPGRLDQYKTFSGLDQSVKNFLKAEIEVEIFISDIYKIIQKVIKKYIKNNFNYLSINFGCTGGQHRSVYCAEKLAEIITEDFGFKIIVEHTQKEFWKK